MRSYLSVRPLLFLSLIVFSSCNLKKQNQSTKEGFTLNASSLSAQTQDPDFYYGADLSYVNELEDCGAVYKNAEGHNTDPYSLFSEAGTNLIRLRLWHNPDWTNYSTLEDVKRSIKRAKANRMRVLLDFHYSDDWADPQKQEIPKAWEKQADSTEALGALLYNYTYSTLTELDNLGLLPELVQVGNEINSMILRKGETGDTINWARNSYLINRGIEAVRQVEKDTRKELEIVLHIAQPENALWWFKDATKHGVTDYDFIGLSYYPIWSEYKLNTLEEALSELIRTYSKKLMIVETAYPFTLENYDEAGNILNKDALIDSFQASPQGQLDYLLALKKVVKKAGGQGIVYWEPAWISTKCETKWGKGSHWENAAFFDKDGRATPAMKFFNHPQTTKQ